MMNISNAMGSGGVEKYHEKEYANEQENYFSEGQVETSWHGELAKKWGLEGAVDGKHFRRLARGCDPHTGELLIGAVQGKRAGVRNTHRAAWDLTISAPKSVSITAILGNRPEVYAAHRKAVTAALSAIEPYATAHLGGNRGQEVTGNLAIACFEHDTARPVGNRPDARRDVQLHTHCVAFNMTRAKDKIRSLEPRELFCSQKLATAVYRASLARSLQAAGYEMLIDPKTGAPEIAGYTKEYLLAASQRSAQIDANLAKAGLERRAGTTKRAVRINRAAKRQVDPAVVRAAQLELAREYGDQHRRVIARMLRRGPQVQKPYPERGAAVDALAHALDHCTARSATTTARDVLTEAFRACLGRASPPTVYGELKNAMQRGDVVKLDNGRAPGIRITTREMIKLERACVRACLESRATCEPLIDDWHALLIELPPRGLSAAQLRVFTDIISQKDRVYALQGLAGVGKTRLLSALATDAAKAGGYRVVGLAPSGIAAASLAAAGVRAQTMQKFLARRDEGHRRLFIVDESSLASTRLMHAFLRRLRGTDRVLLVGDVAQHESVEAGRMFGQLQRAGIGCSVLGEIRRQKNPKLRAAVTLMAQQDVAGALSKLSSEQIREIRSPAARFGAIADELAKQPEGTLVIAPTHHERREITKHIRERLRADGHLGPDVVVTALDPRNDYTEPGLKKAYTYHEGDVVRFRVGSKVLGLAGGSYATVVAVDATHNRLGVATRDGRTVVYDPSRLSGVEIYQERERAFATGDRVLVTLGNREKRIPKSAVGSITELEGTSAKVRLDDGRTTTLDLAEWRHIDHAFVLTSYAAQSLTTARVLVHIDTGHAEAMINERFGYVAASRAVHEAVLFTDRADMLAQKLGREHSNTSALESYDDASLESLSSTVEALREIRLRVEQQATRLGVRLPEKDEERTVAPGITLAL